MKANHLIKNGFSKMAELYEKSLPIFYPTIESRGIHECNLVHLFLVALRESVNSPPLPTWLELPFVNPEDKKTNKDRVDGAAFIQKSKTLLLIEAKRIKQGKTNGRFNTEIALSQIFDDANRMGETNRLEKMGKEMIGIDLHIKVHRLMIGDIWQNGESHMLEAYEKWQCGEAFPPSWKNGWRSKSEIKGYKGYMHLC